MITSGGRAKRADLWDGSEIAEHLEQKPQTWSA
jgi:hypothetical protein